MLCTTGARAEGGDIIVVEPQQPIADIANTNAEEALEPENRGILVRMVAYGCTRKARQQPQFVALSKIKGGRDVAAGYCQCMAAGMIEHLTKDHIKTIIKTRQADPALQAEMQPVANRCMQEASK